MASIHGLSRPILGAGIGSGGVWHSRQQQQRQQLFSSNERSLLIARVSRRSDSNEGDSETLEGLASAVRGFPRGGRSGGRGRGTSSRGGGGGGRSSRGRGERGRGGRGDRGRSSSSSSSRPSKPAPSSKGFGSTSSSSSSSSKYKSGQREEDTFDAASFLDESELLSQQYSPQYNDTFIRTTRGTGSPSGYSSDDADDVDKNTAIALEELSDAEFAEILGQDTAGPDTLAGIDPALESNLNSVLSEFKFPLDAFQIKSVRHILSGRSVVV